MHGVGTYEYIWVTLQLPSETRPSETTGVERKKKEKKTRALIILFSVKLFC